MSETPDTPAAAPSVVNVETIAPLARPHGPYIAAWRGLTPSMRERGGTLGVNHITLPPGGVTCPFHWHAREDEAFFILSGRGVLRYGDSVREIGPGDCISCPAGTQQAHQIGNPFDADLVYLAIGPFAKDEVCVYPDTGKMLVRAAGRIGYLEDAEYFDREAATPDAAALFALWHGQRGV